MKLKFVVPDSIKTTVGLLSPLGLIV